MSVKYTFSIADTVNSTADLEALTSEIQVADIMEALDYINIDGSTLDIWFKMALPQDEQTTLSGIISAHTGEPLVTNIWKRPTSHTTSMVTDTGRLKVEMDWASHTLSGTSHTGQLADTQIPDNITRDSELTTVSGYLQTQIDTINNNEVEDIQDVIGTSLSGINIDITYDDASGITTLSGNLGGGVIDHGNLTGLSDDDHTQYVLSAGTRGFTGTVSGIDPVADEDLATKYYVDSVTASGVSSGRAGKHDIPNATDTFTVTFDSVMPDTNYYVVGSVENQTDQYPAKYGFNIDNLTVNGFDVELSDITDSGNYKFHYVAVDSSVRTVGIAADMSTDTSPQLGGNLDTNGNDILFGTDTISGTGTIVTGDHGPATSPEVVNVIYGTGDAPTTSGGEYPIGTLYIKYTA